jgi:hypothetical protein
MPLFYGMTERACPNANLMTGRLGFCLVSDFLLSQLSDGFLRPCRQMENTGRTESV